MGTLGETLWTGKGVDDVISADDILRNAHTGETFRVVRVNRHDAVAISNQYGNQVAIPRHQFVEGDFLKVDGAAYRNSYLSHCEGGLHSQQSVPGRGAPA
jgi:hypothetical protein